MTLVMPAVPLRSVRTDTDGPVSLATEIALWSGLQCVVTAPHYSRLATTGDRIRHLVTVGMELRIPPGLACSWLRIELRLTGDRRPVGIFPEIVFSPSDAVGAARTTPAGRVDRDLAPGGELPAYLIGWITDDGAVVWDVLPIGTVAPEQLTDLLVLCEGTGEDRPVLELRLVLRLHDPALGERLASFSGVTISEEGGDVDVTPEPVSRFVEPVLTARPTEAAGDLVARMTRADVQWSVLVASELADALARLSHTLANPTGYAAPPAVPDTEGKQPGERTPSTAGHDKDTRKR